MNSKLLNDAASKTWALVFATGDEAPELLLNFAREHRICSGHFIGIGGFSEVTLGYFDITAKQYRPIPVREQVEIVSLIGNITLHEGEPRIHAHVVIGKSDGTAHAGHLVQGRVRPTLEVMVVEHPAPLERMDDPDYGLPLIRL